MYSKKIENRKIIFVKYDDFRSNDNNWFEEILLLIVYWRIFGFILYLAINGVIFYYIYGNLKCIEFIEFDEIYLIEIKCKE